MLTIIRFTTPTSIQRMRTVSQDVRVANQRYHENGMLVNDSKHQGLVLGDTDYSFSFPVKDMLEIFGMEIDNKLNFSRIINQFNVMLRFRKLIEYCAKVMRANFDEFRRICFEGNERA